MVKQNWKQELFPFKSNYINLNNSDNNPIQQHYIDEGEGEVIVMLHGNPTWSFYYRNLIKDLKKTHRVIVPDHIGCGLSDKPQDYKYILKNHIDNIESLLLNLKIKKINLIVHDWGGAIGFGLLQRNNINAHKIVILNTAAFTSTYIPPLIKLCKTPFLGEKLIRLFNGFAGPATILATKRKLNKLEKEGYLFPYNNYKNRIATSRFVEDIPMTKDHPSYSVLKDIEDHLPNINCPKLFLWGKKDFCFNDNFLTRWQEIYPKDKYCFYENAGHYVIEDEPIKTLNEIKLFL